METLETWKPAIEIAVIALLFLMSAYITTSRLRVPMPVIGVTETDIRRESELTSMSAATTAVYAALLIYLILSSFLL